MKRFYKTFRKYKKDIQAKLESKKKKGTEVICYKCKEPGHIWTQCPKLKKKKKDKAMMAGTLRDSDISSSDDKYEKSNDKETKEEAKKAWCVWWPLRESKVTKQAKRNPLG